MRWTLTCIAAWVGFAATADAQTAVVFVGGEADADTRRSWERRLGAGDGVVDFESAIARREPPGAVTPDRLAVIREIDAALNDARDAAARLDERAALIRLVGARNSAEANLEIPGMAAWLAEVQIATALVALQAGMGGLFDRALERAASLDPSRPLLAAEAPPAVIHRARAIHRRIVTAPRGRFEVRASVPDAVLFLDDRPLGRLPRRVEVGAGLHILRVEAEGYVPWARRFRVLEGDRAPVEVALSPTRSRRMARAALEAGGRGEVSEVEDALRALADSPALVLLWRADSIDRAVSLRCAREGCEAPVRLDQTSGNGAAGVPLTAALRWMSERADASGAEREVLWWERWEPWVGVLAGAAVIGAVVGAAVVTEQSRDSPLVVVIEPPPM